MLIKLNDKLKNAGFTRHERRRISHEILKNIESAVSTFFTKMITVMIIQITEIIIIGRKFKQPRTIYKSAGHSILQPNYNFGQNWWRFL